MVVEHPVRLLDPPDPRPSQFTGSGTLLALSVEQHRVRGCLLESIAGVYRLAAWLALPRLGERHLADQVAGLCRQLGSRLGRRLWDDEAHAPLLHSDDPTRYPPIEQLAFTLSPRPYLRAWAVGLTDGHSLGAARRAINSSAAQLAGTTTIGVEAGAETLVQHLAQAHPDVLVVVGGYDLPQAARPVQALAGVVASALGRLPRRGRPAVLFAGSRYAAAQAVETLRAVEGLTVAAAPNVLPMPGQVQWTAVARALDEHYWRLCRRLDGFALLEEWATSPAAMTTVETNFTRLVQSWMAIHRLPELHALYCGDRWLHVWAVEGEHIPEVAFADPDPAQPVPPGWPPLALLSGPWPERTPPAGLRWWDRSGLAPVAAALGPVAPVALYQVLQQDLLLP